MSTKFVKCNLSVYVICNVFNNDILYIKQKLNPSCKRCHIRPPCWIYTCRPQFTPHHLPHCSLPSLILMVLVCGQSVSISLTASSLSQLPSLLMFFYLLVSHQTNPDVLLTGILALTLPVASETCEQAPGPMRLGKPSSTRTPLLAPPNRQLHSSTDHRLIGFICAGIKVCKGWPHHSHTHTVHTESR